MHTFSLTRLLEGIVSVCLHATLKKILQCKCMNSSFALSTIWKICMINIIWWYITSLWLWDISLTIYMSRYVILDQKFSKLIVSMFWTFLHCVAYKLIILSQAYNIFPLYFPNESLSSVCLKNIKSLQKCGRLISIIDLLLVVRAPSYTFFIVMTLLYD